MIPLIGYSNRLSVEPGESIEFKVSSSLDKPYQASLVRVRCGDPNPAGACLSAQLTVVQLPWRPQNQWSCCQWEDLEVA